MDQNQNNQTIEPLVTIEVKDIVLKCGSIPVLVTGEIKVHPANLHLLEMGR